MQTIIVTGGAGFIGSNLIERLLKQRRALKVICIDNMSPSYEVRIKENNILPFKKNKRFSFYKVNICDKKSLEKVFTKEKPIAVVHLAAEADTRRSVREPYIYEEVNIRGTLNLLELSKKYVKKFIFISSSSVYGNKAKIPFSEDSITDFPIAPYGATKKAAEVLAYTYFHNFGLPITCLRIFNAYGERNRPDLVIYKWVEKIFSGEPIEISGNGSRKRDFTYVGDIVNAIILTLKKAKGFNILNIGNSKSISLKELLQKVEKAVGRKAIVVKRPSHKASVEYTLANITKAKKVLGWWPKVSLEEGLLRFVKWFRDDRF